MKIHTFKVRGCGEFPVDMLRYCRAWPASESESQCIQYEHDVRTVQLESLDGHKAPERWESFGWEVLVDFSPMIVLE